MIIKLGIEDAQGGETKRDLHEISPQSKEENNNIPGEEVKIQLVPNEKEIQGFHQEKQHQIPHSDNEEDKKDVVLELTSPLPKNMHQPQTRVPSNFRQLIMDSVIEDFPDESSDLHIVLPSHNQPELEKLDQIWATLIFICNVYNCYSFFFFLGISMFPSGIWLMLELGTEFLMLFDAILITIIHIGKPELLEFMPLIQISDDNYVSIYQWIAIWLSSYPQSIINVLIGLPYSTLSSFPIACLRLLKLLRYPDIGGYINKQLRHVSGLYAAYLEGAQFVLKILLLFHIMGICWLTPIRLETNQLFLTEFGYIKASILEYYVDAVFIVVSNMDGMCYGDTYPVTLIEKLAYCFIVAVGCTFLASLFGNLVNSIYISNAKSIENLRKMEQVEVLCETRGLPEELQKKIQFYFSSIHLKYSKYGIFHI